MQARQCCETARKQKPPKRPCGEKPRRWWDVQWWKEHWPEIAFPREGLLHGLLDDVLVHVMQPVLDFDSRPGAGSNNAWWKGDGEQVAQFLWGFESLWLPASLLENDAQLQRLADALFASSPRSGVGLHFNKGLAGAPLCARRIQRRDRGE
jgi:hypothetical protein